MRDLFSDLPAEPGSEAIGDGAVVLRGYANGMNLSAAVDRIHLAAPFRHMVTPNGHTMSVAMTNCGALGWVTSRAGYRYQPTDPDTGRPWPAIPEIFRSLAIGAAREAGYAGFQPDACLVNRYAPGTRLSLHQDRNERDMTSPIVSVSMGLPAVFLFGGSTRRDKPLRIRVEHGDVVVWGGPTRLAFHGVAPLADGLHAEIGRCRINLTFRKAG